MAQPAQQAALLPCDQDAGGLGQEARESAKSELKAVLNVDDRILRSAERSTTADAQAELAARAGPHSDQQKPVVARPVSMKKKKPGRAAHKPVQAQEPPGVSQKEKMLRAKADGLRGTEIQAGPVNTKKKVKPVHIGELTGTFLNMITHSETRHIEGLNQQLKMKEEECLRRIAAAVAAKTAELEALIEG
jgi:hypothetical protein